MSEKEPKKAAENVPLERAKRFSGDGNDIVITHDASKQKTLADAKEKPAK